MDAGFLNIAEQSLLSPPLLFFVLGAVAAFLKSDLNLSNGMTKGLSLYLMFSIGFKGGIALREAEIDQVMLMALGAGVILSFIMPLMAFSLLKILASKLRTIDMGAIAAHYGSVSVVTFVTAVALLEQMNISYEGYMVAVLAIMETPAIITGLLLATYKTGNSHENAFKSFTSLLTSQVVLKVLVNGSVVLLIGSFLIGWMTGDKGMAAVSPFIVAPFQGVLCLYLLDMGLVAVRKLRDKSDINFGVLMFGIIMPLLGALLGGLFATIIGLSQGGVFLLMVLTASASYIAVPAALRMALPEANPSLYITLSLGITFPFNILIGLPLYFESSKFIMGLFH